MAPALSEKIELLGKGMYKNIPDQLTLKSIPTLSELDYISSEDFDATMLDKILPVAIEEDINPRELLEIDYQWICRCLRILNYGPYHTVNAIFCNKCGIARGEYSVDLRSIECKPLPENFTNSFKLTADDFVDFDGEIEFKLPTIQDILNSYKDKAFQTADGKPNKELARICYMIKSIKGVKNLTPIEIKLSINKNLSSADYRILSDEVLRLSDYGLRAGGRAMCPTCGSKDAGFLALVDDRFFRTTVGDLRKWKHDRNSGGNKNT